MLAEVVEHLVCELVHLSAPLEERRSRLPPPPRLPGQLWVRLQPAWVVGIGRHGLELVLRRTVRLGQLSLESGDLRRGCALELRQLDPGRLPRSGLRPSPTAGLGLSGGNVLIGERAKEDGGEGLAVSRPAGVEPLVVRWRRASHSTILGRVTSAALRGRPFACEYSRKLRTEYP